MKTTEINFSNDDSSKTKKTMSTDATLPLTNNIRRSLRPQKSMVRVKSLRPKRLGGVRKVSIHSFAKK